MEVEKLALKEMEKLEVAGRREKYSKCTGGLTPKDGVVRDGV